MGIAHLILKVHDFKLRAVVFLFFSSCLFSYLGEGTEKTDRLMRLISWRSLGKEKEGHLRWRNYNDKLLF